VKKNLLPILAFVIPIVVYFWVVLGWSVGEDCVAGVNGIVESGIKNYYYCQQQIDAGAYSWQHLPQWRLVAKDWLSGVVPLWNPHQGVGVPLAANFISSAYNPFLVLFNTLGSLLVTRWYLVLRLAFASLGMFLFLSKFTKSKWPSLAGALFFVFSGYFTQYFSMAHHDIDFCLPWLLYFLLLTKERNIYWGINSLLVALTILAGMPESTVMVLGVYFLFAFYAVWQEKSKDRVKLYLFFLASTICGIAISAVLLLPGLEYIKMAASSRVIGLKDIYSVEAKNIFYWIFPRIAGPFHNILTRRADLLIANSNYFGVLASVFVLAGFWTKGFKFVKILFLIAIAQYFGVIHLPLNLIPILKDTIYVKYSLGVINFLAAILLVRGMTLWLEVKEKRFGVMVVFGAISLLGAIYFGNDLIAAIGSVPLWKAKATVAFMALQSALAIISVILLYKVKKEKYLALLLILEMILYTPLFGDRIQSTSLPTPPFVSWLVEHNDGSRIFSTDGTLYPDYASYYGLNDIRNLDALWPKNYYEYLKNNIQPDLDMAWMRFCSSQDTPDQREAKILSNPYFDKLSVKYIISRKSIDSLQLKLVFDQEIKVYENLNAMERLRFEDSFGREKYARGIIRNVEFGGSEVTANYVATESGFVVLADTNYPGWIVKINGKQQDTIEVDELFRGVVVPAGENKIEFVYQSKRYGLGLKITIIGLVGTILLLSLGAKRVKND
jgi:hypothetical protein